MGLAKNATELAQEELRSLQQPVSDGRMGAVEHHTVHPEVYKYFNINPIDTDSDLKNLYSWASEGAKSASEALVKIKRLETKLGQPNSGETRVSKLNNWVRMTQNIKDIDLSYKQEMMKIKDSHNKMLQDLRSKKGEELSRLTAEIDKIENKYKDVYKTTRARSMSEMYNIKSEYERQLKELKSMRGVYQKGK